MSIEQIRVALTKHPDIQLAIVFGSVARGNAHRESDIDVAVQAARPLTAQDKLHLIDDLAVATGRPVDLIDLRTAGEPLLGQILAHGTRIRGHDDDYAELVLRHVYASEDFMPYVKRLHAQRNHAWTE